MLGEITKDVERVGQQFCDEKIQYARQMTWRAIEAIAASIRVGMLEEEAHHIADKILSDLGAQKRWHRTHVRFGKNTLLYFGQRSEPKVSLADDDIFFVDIGPVWDGHEGDAGKTFCVGHDEQMIRCVRDTEALYQLVRQQWLALKWSGEKLYRFAEAEASKLGWVLNLKESNGHRISEFPHALYHQGSIEGLPFAPAANRWILEIQLRHPERPFGAFYEDLLF